MKVRNMSFLMQSLILGYMVYIVKDMELNFNLPSKNDLLAEEELEDTIESIEEGGINYL